MSSPSNFSQSCLPNLVASSLMDFKQSSIIDFDSVEANLSHLALYRAVEASDDVDYDTEPKLYTNVKYTERWTGNEKFIMSSSRKLQFYVFQDHLEHFSCKFQ